MPALRRLEGDNVMASGVRQVKDGDVFAIGKVSATRPRGLFPLIWEDEPGGRLIARDVFAERNETFSRENYEQALKFCKIELFSCLETWVTSEDMSLRSYGGYIAKGYLSLWGELST